MSDTAWAALFTALPPTLVALAALWNTIKTKQKVEEVRHATNSIKDALVAATKAEALLQGRAEGVAAEKAEAALRAAGVATEKAEATERARIAGEGGPH